MDYHQARTEAKGIRQGPLTTVQRKKSSLTRIGAVKSERRAELDFTFQLAGSHSGSDEQCERETKV